MRSLSRPFVLAALLAMPLALAACKPMVVVADPVTIHRQVAVVGEGGILPGGRVLTNAKRVAADAVAAKALAGRPVDYGRNEVVVVDLGERLTAGGSATIQAIQRKEGTLFVQAVITEPSKAQIKDAVPTRLCVVAVVQKAAPIAIDVNEGLRAPILEPSRVVVEIK